MDAVGDFGRTAPDKKLWERMTVLDLHTRELYHDSHNGSKVKRRGYVVPTTATARVYATSAKRNRLAFGTWGNNR
eukprot:12727104-Prorocentrum_lima.AAC.1